MTGKAGKNNKVLSPVTESYEKMFQGKFFGVLHWHQLDKIWSILKNHNDSWFIYAVGEIPPEQSVSKEKLLEFIEEIDRLLRREHDEDYCGIVYANSLSNPSLIKIFDPSNLGTSCSIASKGPSPSWIMSQMKPDELMADIPKTANNRGRWWQKFFSICAK